MSNEQLSITEMTREEYEALKAELDRLTTVVREEVSEKIRVARGFGDLSENSEYDEARNEQARVEATIARLKEQLKNVVVVDTIRTDVVSIGGKVVLRDLEFGDEEEYRVAGNGAMSESANVVSVDSPVGQAILGRRVGETVQIMTPSKHTYEMQIVSISK